MRSLSFLLLLAAAGAAQILVDAGQTVGTIRSFQGVNAGPFMPRRPQMDVTAWYRRLRLQSVRTHDYYGPFDLPTIYPDQSKDPTLASSYNFTSTDLMARAILDTGARIYLRLGTSWNTPNWRVTNLDRIAEACRRIVLHLNHGWANGFRLGIRRVEFWNEPNGPRFWQRTPQDFYLLYAKTVAKLKADDPQLQVGACGVAGAQPGAYREDLIKYCAQNRIPLDFYSWHVYKARFTPEGPYHFVNVAATIRQILNANGLTRTQQDLTEWNVALSQERDPILTRVKGAAFTASALIYFQDAGITMAHHYRGDVFTGASPYNMGLFADPSTPNPRGYVFLLSGRMQLTPHRLPATGGDKKGFSALAGRSPDGREVQILVSDYPGSAVGRTLTVRNLPAGRYLVEAWGMDSRPYRLAVQALQTLNGTFTTALPAGPSVYLFRLRRAAGAGPVLAFEDPDLPYQDVLARLTLTGGPAGARYVIGLSVSGTAPGTPLPGSSLVLPLNLDALTFYVLMNLAKPKFAALAGVLDAAGNAQATFDFDAVDPSLVGVAIHAAAVLYQAGRFLAVTKADRAVVR